LVLVLLHFRSIVPCSVTWNHPRAPTSRRVSVLLSKRPRP
jgi:hypothetical protein